MDRAKAVLRTESLNILKIVVGCVIYALSVVLFIDPVQIIPGSVTGIGVVVKTLTGFPIGMLSIIINVPLVIWGTIKLGKKLLIYTGLTVLLSSVLIDAFAFMEPFTTDVLLASIFGGVVMGVGLGLILDGGGTTGGTTVVGRLALLRWPNIPMGNILLIGDFIIILVGSLLLKDWDLMLYSVLDLYVCVIFINKVMYGFKTKTVSVIQSDKIGALLEKIKAQTACTVLSAGTDKAVVVNRKSDLGKVQLITEAEDSQAACVSMDADLDFGSVFKNIKIKG